MQVEPLAIEGCYLLRPDRHADRRGEFVKLFHAPTLAALGLETSFRESYLSTSNAGVLRGMHFQRPPHDHTKLVGCTQGQAKDGLVDLRAWSPTFGRTTTVMLSGEEPAVVYIPRGVAHGFAAYRDHTQMWYLVSSEHAPQADAGIDAVTVGIAWWEDGAPVLEPIVSERDQRFPSLATYLTMTDFRMP